MARGAARRGAASPLRRRRRRRPQGHLRLRDVLTEPSPPHLVCSTSQVVSTLGEPVAISATCVRRSSWGHAAEVVCRQCTTICEVQGCPWCHSCSDGDHRVQSCSDSLGRPRRQQRGQAPFGDAAGASAAGAHLSTLHCQAPPASASRPANWRSTTPCSRLQAQRWEHYSARCGDAATAHASQDAQAQIPARKRHAYVLLTQ